MRLTLLKFHFLLPQKSATKYRGSYCCKTSLILGWSFLKSFNQKLLFYCDCCCQFSYFCYYYLCLQISFLQCKNHNGNNFTSKKDVPELNFSKQGPESKHCKYQSNAEISVTLRYLNTKLVILGKLKIKTELWIRYPNKKLDIIKYLLKCCKSVFVGLFLSKVSRFSFFLKKSI